MPAACDCGRKSRRGGLARFKEFVAFSLSLNRLDGRVFLRESSDFRKNMDPWFLQFVRDDDELRVISGIVFLASRGSIRMPRSTSANGRARNTMVRGAGACPDAFLAARCP